MLKLLPTLLQTQPQKQLTLLKALQTQLLKLLKVLLLLLPTLLKALQKLLLRLLNKLKAFQKKRAVPQGAALFLCRYIMTVMASPRVSASWAI